MISSNKKIIINGCVGVGKTTTISHLTDKFKKLNIPYFIVPEYIDGDDKGNEYLQQYLKGIMKPYDFQLYVLGYYDKFLSNLNVDKNTYLIFERIPDDSVFCFSNILHERGMLTEDELNDIYNLSKDISNKYNIPTYSDNANKDRSVLIYESINTDDVCDKIINDLKTDTATNVFVGLTSSKKTCYDRMKIRNRESYTFEEIARFHNYCSNLYSIMLNNVKLSVENMKCLLEETE